ncbi:NrdH-like glutaredoxin [Microbacterium phage Pabst]|nr:NrdH-like glutaredoxin [Microbacterium phage Pabst]
MNTPITLWSKPVCVQCTMVKKRIIEQFTGERGLDREDTLAYWNTLIREGKVVEYDLTAEENKDQLEYFKELGYLMAPITEYQNHAVPGFIVAEIDDMVASWKVHNVV